MKGRDSKNLRCYFWGEEIDKIQTLQEILKSDDWLEGFLHWTSHDKSWKEMYVVVSESPEDEDNKTIDAIWVASMPVELRERLGKRVRVYSRGEAI